MMEISKGKIKMLVDGARDVTGGEKVVELGNEMLSHLKREKLDLVFTEWIRILCLASYYIARSLSAGSTGSFIWGQCYRVGPCYDCCKPSAICPRLKNFTLVTQSDICHIIEVLATGNLQLLERLDLEVDSTNDNSIEFLFTFLRNSSSLQHLSIRSLASSPQKLLELLQIVDNHPTLQEMSVKNLGCRLTTDVDVNALGKLCSKYCDSMRTGFIRFIGGLSYDGVVVLVEFLQHKYGSRKLDLSSGGTSDDGTISLAKAIHHNSTIHILRLPSNSIGDKGAVALADALHHNSTLQSLYLYDNSIGDKGVVALADAFHHNSTLQSLYLNINSIGDDRGVALAEALLENQSLQKLFLYSNDDIGDRTTGKFLEALTQNLSINTVVVYQESVRNMLLNVQIIIKYKLSSPFLNGACNVIAELQSVKFHECANFQTMYIQ